MQLLFQSKLQHRQSDVLLDSSLGGDEDAVDLKL
jgi:hypothetical protein